MDGNEAKGRASNYPFDANGVILTQPVVGSSVFKVNHAKFLPAPGVGFAWSPLAKKGTVIHAGFGLYSALRDNLSYRLDQNGPYNTVFAVSKLIANWQLSGIETIESGLPFTPQLSYNPPNDGDTRNPVRPSWNAMVLVLRGTLSMRQPNVARATSWAVFSVSRPQCSSWLPTITLTAHNLDADPFSSAL